MHQTPPHLRSVNDLTPAEQAKAAVRAKADAKVKAKVDAAFANGERHGAETARSQYLTALEQHRKDFDARAKAAQEAWAEREHHRVGGARTLGGIGGIIIGACAGFLAALASIQAGMFGASAVTRDAMETANGPPIAAPLTVSQARDLEEGDADARRQPPPDGADRNPFTGRPLRAP